MQPSGMPRTIKQHPERVNGQEHQTEFKRFDARVNISQPPSTYLNKFYYDCLTHSEPALRMLIDSVGVDRVIFGTDWPDNKAISLRQQLRKCLSRWCHPLSPPSKKRTSGARS